MKTFAQKNSLLTVVGVVVAIQKSIATEGCGRDTFHPF